MGPTCKKSMTFDMFYKSHDNLKKNQKLCIPVGHRISSLQHRKRLFDERGTTQLASEAFHMNSSVIVQTELF